MTWWSKVGGDFWKRVREVGWQGVEVEKPANHQGGHQPTLEQVTQNTPNPSSHKGGLDTHAQEHARTLTLNISRSLLALLPTDSYSWTSAHLCWIKCAFLHNIIYLSQKQEQEFEQLKKIEAIIQKLKSTNLEIYGFQFRVWLAASLPLLFPLLLSAGFDKIMGAVAHWVCSKAPDP